MKTPRERAKLRADRHRRVAPSDILLEKLSNVGMWVIVPEHLTPTTSVLLRDERQPKTMYFGSPAMVAAARQHWRLAKDGRYRLHVRDVMNFQVFEFYRERSYRRQWSAVARQAARDRMRAYWKERHAHEGKEHNEN